MSFSWAHQMGETWKVDAIPLFILYVNSSANISAHVQKLHWQSTCTVFLFSDAPQNTARDWSCPVGTRLPVEGSGIHPITRWEWGVIHLNQQSHIFLWTATLETESVTIMGQRHTSEIYLGCRKCLRQPLKTPSFFKLIDGPQHLGGSRKTAGTYMTSQTYWGTCCLLSFMY